MIKTDQLNINCINDYDKLKDLIKKEYYHEVVINEIKQRIGTKCTQLFIEYPYYDKDYLSTYYSFYAKLFNTFQKESYRIHIFNNEEYLGYFTLRPTVGYTKIGKSYLSPKLLLNDTAHVLTSNFEVNILGNKTKISAFPWMYQETDISVCAHVAVWSIIRYYGNKYNIYADKRMMDIVNETPNGIGRNIPSGGLVLTQIAEIFKKNNFHPLIIQKKQHDNGDFFDEVYSYIESGIPMVAASTQFGHAFTIVGHGKPNFEKLNTCTANITLSSNIIESLIVNDDNYLPYLEVSSKYVAQNKIQKYDLEDIDFVIVPLYDRMMLGYWSVRNTVQNLITSQSYNFNPQNVLRIYITSSNSLKSKMISDSTVDSDLKFIISHMRMPKFIWCADISTPAEYKNGSMSCKIIIDITAGTYEANPFLLIQSKDKLVYKDENKYYVLNKHFAAYNIYKHNLEEV